ncbi:MAG: gamma-glutamyltransferase [Polyangiaceae bacterium]|nr:gamma-glutamyltransferase [Polyangiaceae bacterium]
MGHRRHTTHRAPSARRARGQRLTSALLLLPLVLTAACGCSRVEAPIPDRPKATPAQRERPPEPARKSTTVAAQDAGTLEQSATPAASAPGPAPSPEPACGSTLPIPKPGKRAVGAARGVVVSVEAQATRAGVAILEQGGNAVDAAVAVGYALAVTHPSAGNLGGGGFMLVRPAAGPTVAIDFREAAPGRLTRERFESLVMSESRPEAAVGVPGSVAGLNLALKRYGRLTLARVLEPAIRLARNGYRIGPRQASSLVYNWSRLRKNKAALAEFGTSEGRPLPLGTRHRRPGLAAVLERIKASGDAGFYQGETAQALLASVEPSGLMTAEDLTSYRAKIREPLVGGYRGLTVQVMPPPSAGGVAETQLLSMLEQLEAYKLPRTSGAELHLFVEAARRAHLERRLHVLDPDTLSEAESHSHEPAWLASTPALTRHPVDPKHATPSSKLSELYAGAAQELEHTTHFAVVDADGMAISCTVTLSSGFGSRIVVPGTGIVLNNTLAAFSVVGQNQPAPLRRPTSSMTPTLVLDHGRLLLVLGSPGGDTIPNTIVQVLRNIIDYALPLDDAVDAFRIHHGFVPDEIRYEAARPPPREALAHLERMGHRLSKKRAQMGDANSILVAETKTWAYADPREGGLALAVPEKR